MEIKVLGQTVDIGSRGIDGSKLATLEARGIQVGDVAPSGAGNVCKYLGGNKFEGFDHEGRSMGVREIPETRMPVFIAGFLVQQCFLGSKAAQ